MGENDGLPWSYDISSSLIYCSICVLLLAPLEQVTKVFFVSFKCNFFVLLLVLAFFYLSGHHLFITLEASGRPAAHSFGDDVIDGDCARVQCRGQGR